MKTAPDALVESCLDYVLDHGLATLSLRPLASAVGVSDRMLMYHFGSKDGLIEQVVSRANRRLTEHIAGLDSPDGGGMADTIRAAWSYLTDAEGLRISGLYLDLCLLSTRDPERWGQAHRELRASWIAALPTGALPTSALPTKDTDGIHGDDPMHTLVVDTVDGLLLDRLATGETARVEAALDTFIELVNGRSLPSSG